VAPTAGPGGGPLGGLVDTVTRTAGDAVAGTTTTVTGAVSGLTGQAPAPVPVPTPGESGSGGTTHPSTGGGSTGSQPSVATHHQPTASVGLSRAVAALPRSLGRDPVGTEVPATNRVAAASAPQLAPHASLAPHGGLGLLGRDSLPAAVVVIGVAAVAAVAAGHIGVWTNGRRPVVTAG
jgi:hypothetical protein